MMSEDREVRYLTNKKSDICPRREKKNAPTARVTKCELHRVQKNYTAANEGKEGKERKKKKKTPCRV